MAGALLYQSSQRWRFGLALGAAALIHFAAVALASVHQHEQQKELPPGEDFIPTVEFESHPPTDNPTPPPDLVDPPISTPPDETMVPEEVSTPAPVHRQTSRLAAPIVKTKNATIGSISLSSARVNALSAPRPEYPYEARRQKITGNGIVSMTVDPVSGSVISVVMEASTGNPVLDNAAVTGFRKWRFKPGTVSRVRSQIIFTMAGAQY